MNIVITPYINDGNSIIKSPNIESSISNYELIINQQIINNNESINNQNIINNLKVLLGDTNEKIFDHLKEAYHFYNDNLLKVIDT